MKMYQMRSLVCVLGVLVASTSTSGGGSCVTKIKDGKFVSEGDCENSKASSVIMDLERKLKTREKKTSQAATTSSHISRPPDPTEISTKTSTESTTASIHGCPLTNLTFPREGRLEDYLLYSGSTVPQLANVSICTWLTPPIGRQMSTGGILSYYKYDTNDDYGNTMLIFYRPKKGLSITTHGNTVDWDIKPVRDRTHFCFLVFTVERKAEIFQNGVSLGEKNITSNAAIPAGGALVIGNDQDRASDADTFLGRMEDLTQTFTGKIENLYIWNRILGEDEIEKFRNDACACPRDHIIALTEANVEKHGEVQVASLLNACS